MASEQLIAMVKSFEGCRLMPYICPAGILTAGYGATGAGVFPGEAWTQERADDRLEADLEHFIDGVEGLCPNLTGDALDAIVDFAYNCGLGALKASTLRKRLNAGDWDGAKKELLRWTRGGGRVLPGLVRRRAAEAALLKL